MDTTPCCVWSSRQYRHTGFQHSYGKFTHPCEIPNDVLKQNYLQSFKTRRFHFDKDVKNETVVSGSFL
ncbi:hypothetical protein HMPREF9554_02916 [Treponema phagedenis F0421]|nr:hypothetical protein HMPREF9554_02916 [Treponema phagedenis F0421]